MPRRTSEGYASQVAGEEGIMVTSELEQAQGNGHQEATQAEVVKLLAAILNQVRSEAAVLRPPPLTAATEEAMLAYIVMSGATNPSRSPEFYQSNG